MNQSLNNELVRGWTGTLTTATTGETRLTEDAGLRSLVERDSHVGEIVRRMSLYCDGALADELEVIDEWMVRIACKGKTVCVKPLGQLAQARPAMETNGALATGQTEYVRSDASGGVPGIVLPSVEDAVDVYLFPGPQAAAPAPGADVTVGIFLHFEEFRSDKEITR